MKHLLLVCLAMLVAGCGGTEPQAQAPAPDTTKPAAVEVSFARDIQPIVTASCLPCHSGAKDAKSKYNWTTYEGVIAEVVPGKPDSSKFYQVLNDGTMPPAGKLDAAKLGIVNKWITEGARNN